MLKEGDEAVAYPQTCRPLLLGIVFTLGIGLQLYRLTFVTLWSDEFRGTLQLISFPWSTLVTGNYSWELNPPLYFLSFKAWVTVFGTTETVMRLFSILLHSGSLLTIYVLGQKIGSWKAGLAAMSVLAFHPVYTTYATQLRMYPLLILLTLLAFLSFFSYTLHGTHHPAWLLCLGISLTLAAYTHYFGVFAILGIFILSTLYLVLTRDKYQRYVLLITAGTVILCVPVFWLAFQQSLQYAQKALDQTHPHLSMSAILTMFSGSMTMDVELTRMIQMISILSVLGGVVVLVQNNKKVLALSLVSFIGTASVLTIVLSARYLNIASRHLIHVSLMAWLVSSLALLASRDTLSKYLKVLTIAAILINAMGGVSSTLQKSYHSPNWKHIAHIMQQAARPEEPIVIMGWDAAPTSYYLHAEWLTSYDFEKHLHEKHAASYLILDSQYSRKLPFIDLEANVIYTDARWKVKVVRYIPYATYVAYQVIAQKLGSPAGGRRSARHHCWERPARRIGQHRRADAGARRARPGDSFRFQTRIARIFWLDEKVHELEQERNTVTRMLRWRDPCQAARHRMRVPALVQRSTGPTSDKRERHRHSMSA